jgi:hypothetical protein
MPRTYEEQIDDLDAPKPRVYAPDTALSRYLAEQYFFGKAFIRWRGFASKSERKNWHQLEAIYAEPTIRQKIDWAIQHVPPRRVVKAICKALLNHVKPDKTVTMNDLKELEP